jgi:spore germination protein YaaH
MRWEGDKLSALLANPSARANAVNLLFVFVRDNHFAGISIDFENVPISAHSHLKTFMTALYAQFHSAGLLVSQPSRLMTRPSIIADSPLVMIP